jgi:tRNA1Val (adenine37-N6)-methyltransferase
MQNNETLDDLILGGLKVFQPRRGYRFSLDAVLLAHFPGPEPPAVAVDLGTGCGVISLLLAHRFPECRCYGLEIQADMVDRARRSVAYNRLEHRIRIFHHDIRSVAALLPAHSADLVVSNPPFRKMGEGHISQNQSMAIARHELQVELFQVIEAAAYLLPPGGRFCLVHRADRVAEIESLLDKNRLRLKRLRMVHSFPDGPARLALLEGQKEWRGGADVLSPLIIYDVPGSYSREIRSLYEGGNGYGDR